MTLRTIIVEDNLNAAELLKHYLINNNSIEIITISTTVEDAIVKTNHYHPDLLILDIQIGNKLAFEVLDACKGKFRFVIFTTAFENYSLKSHQYQTIHYLLKPILKEDIDFAINKIHTLITVNKNSTNDGINYIENEIPNIKKEITNSFETSSFDTFYYYQNKVWKTINIVEAVYLESNGSYTNIHTIDNFIKVSKNLKSTGSIFLQNEQFIRIHNKYIINVLYIDSIIRGINAKVILKNKIELPVSILYKSAFFEKIGVKK